MADAAWPEEFYEGVESLVQADFFKISETLYDGADEIHQKFCQTVVKNYLNALKKYLKKRKVDANFFAQKMMKLMPVEADAETFDETAVLAIFDDQRREGKELPKLAECIAGVKIE